MRAYIPLNTVCADGRNIAMERIEADLEHRHAEVVRLTILEMKHLASCPACNPDLRLNAMLTALFGENVRVRE